MEGKVCERAPDCGDGQGSFAAGSMGMAVEGGGDQHSMTASEMVVDNVMGVGRCNDGRPRPPLSATSGDLAASEADAVIRWVLPFSSVRFLGPRGHGMLSEACCGQSTRGTGYRGSIPSAGLSPRGHKRYSADTL